MLAAALSSRAAFAMLVYGLASGLPFSLLIGTVTAWLGEAKVDLATVGTLALAGLAYAFKYLWSPVVDRLRLPLLGQLGQRKSWIVAAQVVVVACLAGLVLTDPATAIGRFGLFVMVGAVASATQDVAINGWQIEAADERTPVELLASLYQLGYRTAAIIGGALALFLASQMSWPAVYALMAGVLGMLALLGLLAPEREADRAREHAPLGVRPGIRAIALAIVGLCWAGTTIAIARFVVATLTLPAALRPSAADFLGYQGPAIVAATVLVPLAVAAWVSLAPAGAGEPGHAISDHFYRALVAPLTDLVARLGWGVLLVIGLILTYAICYNVWASFAYPFYLQQLHYSKDEVAFASKLFGIIMSIVGVTLGGVLFVRVGRFPTVLLGAILPIAGNFLYADLAEGGARIDAAAHLLRLDALGADPRMTRLLLAICYENISTGLAGAAFTAFVAGIVSKRFAAVQYALLSSLTFLIGSLGKSVVGEAIDAHGYASVFRWVALAGLPAVLFVSLEWWRASRTVGRHEPGDTGMAA